MTAVQQLSQEIVESQSSGLSKSVDLRVQLADRLEKLHGLICLIAANGKFSLLSQNVLRQLCSDAEVVAAAIDIWDYYSTSVSASLRQEGAATDPLAAAIRATLEAIPNLGWQGDVVRFFFRHHLSHLNDVLARLSNPLELLESSSSAERSRASLIKVNHIVLVSQIVDFSVLTHRHLLKSNVYMFPSRPFKQLTAIEQKLPIYTISILHTFHLKLGLAR